jgi:hypothetical protein
MIGDREDREPETADDLGPLDAAVRLNPPPTISRQGDPIGSLPLPPAWVERYDQVVVLRHVFDNQRESTTTTSYRSAADALRGFAQRVAFLTGRGYQVVEE